MSLTAPNEAPPLPCLYIFSELKEDFIVKMLQRELNDGAMRLYFKRRFYSDS